MTNYKEILRLKSLGLNKSQISDGMGISRQTTVKVIQRAEEQGLSYETAVGLSDKELANNCFRQEKAKSTRCQIMSKYTVNWRKAG